MKPTPRGSSRAGSAAAAQARFLEGYAMQQEGRLAEAQAIYLEVLTLQPTHFDALHLLGLLAYHARDLDRAAALMGDAIKVNPSFAAAHNNRGIVMRDMKKHDAALASFDRAIKLRSNYAEAYNNRALTLRDLQRAQDALDSLDRAVALKPDYAEAHSNRGLALQDLDRHQDALQSLERALALKPDFAEAWYNLGNVLHALKRHDAALQFLDRAVALRPNYAEALNNRGNLLRDLGRHPEALSSFDRSTVARPDYAEAWFNRGNALAELGRFDDARQSLERALALKPDLGYLFGTWLNTRVKTCDWRGLDEDVARLVEKIGRGERAAAAFLVLALTDSLSVQRRAAEILSADSKPTGLALPALPRRPRRDRVRVGYYSADFHDHATAYLMAELFERHDRERFELVAFSFGPDRDDAMRRRVATAFDRFIDVRGRSDREVALLSRELEVDIAVDLKGLTLDCRPGIFAHRAAPVQVNYLGYPGTMGANFIDYLIADETVIPEEARPHFAEKIVWLPGCYQVNDGQRAVAPRAVPRDELGLPADGFVFCCFNNNYKIMPATFDGWMRVLRRVEGSVLWLLEDNSAAAENLRREAEARGVEAGRLVFARRAPPAEHLARHRAADLFLDTLPYGAHTTASDALWAGLPVLTRLGATFPGRVAASLLRSVGLPELIAGSQGEYEALAVALAADRSRLTELKATLARNRPTAPLFDATGFARHIEDAYSQMYERHLAGLAPEHLRVAR